MEKKRKIESRLEGLIAEYKTAKEELNSVNLSLKEHLQKLSDNLSVDSISYPDIF